MNKITSEKKETEKCAPKTNIWNREPVVTVIAGPGTDDGNFYQYMVTAVDTSGNEGNGTYTPDTPVPPIPFAPFGTLLTLGSGLIAYGYYRPYFNKLPPFLT